MNSHKLHASHEVNHTEVDFPINSTIPVILVLNGPNLNMLSVRSPEIYGRTTLANIIEELETLAARAGVSIISFQTNNEGEMLDLIHRSVGKIHGIIINPGAWAHTSLALADALSIPQVPVIEVHISQVYQRESYRHVSYVSTVSKGVISGLGAYGYSAALQFLANHLSE